MAASLLQSVLPSEEINKLPPNISGKLNEHLKSLQSIIDEKNVKYERLRVNSEQQYFELEKQFTITKKGLEENSSFLNKRDVKIKELEENFNNIQSQLKEAKVEYETSNSLQLHFKQCNDLLELEKRDLTDMLNKRNQEIERLTDDWKKMNEKLLSANNAKCEALSGLDEFKSQHVTIEYRQKRLEQEKEMMEQQIQWLNNELNEKNEELLKLRREKSIKCLEMQASIEEKSEELQLLQETTDTLKKSNEEQATRMENYIQKLKDVRDAFAKNEEQFRNELQAQTKLASLYKASAEESEAKVKELTTAVEELQKLLKQAATVHDELEQKLKDIVSNHNTVMLEKEDKIYQLNKELECANELLMTLKKKVGPVSEEGIAMLSPTAAATSKLLKSGMTLTQIYHEYVQVSEQLLLEKEENRRLNKDLDQILQEIETKAPIMKKQREDYQKALETITNLTRQLDFAILDSDKTQSETGEIKRKFGHLTRENDRLKFLTADLGQQVRTLLKEVEEARGGYVSTSHDALPPVCSTDISSSSQVISEKLVSFKNIEELQSKNQQILTVIRELSEKKEEEERTSNDKRVSELQQKLEDTLKDVEEMRLARERQTELVESIVRQRDMYRVLFSQSGSLPLPPSISSPLPGIVQAPQSEDIKSVEAKAALKQLQMDFANYKTQMSENEKILNETLEKLRNEVSDFRIQNAQLSSQLEFSSERFKTLQSNIEGYRKEITALRDKNQKYANNVLKHQETTNSLTQELLSTQEKLSKAEVSSQNLKAERDLLKNIEVRLVQEKESLIKEQSSQSRLLSNLEAIKNNMERSESEIKMRLTNQIDSLEKQAKQLQSKFDMEIQQHQNIVKSYETSLKEVTEQLESEKKFNETGKTELAEAHADINNFKQQILESQAKITDLEAILNDAKHEEMNKKVADTESEIEELKSQLSDALQQIKNLEQQVLNARQHAEQYKSISNSIEQSLKEQNEASEKFKQVTESQLKEDKLVKTRLEKEIKTLEESQQKLMNENIKVTEESHALNADLRKQLSNLQSQLQEAVQKAQDAIKNEQAARQDSLEQARLAKEAHSKYEQELMQHASAVQSLSEIKLQLEGHEKKLNLATEASKTAEETLESKQESWEEQLKLLKQQSDAQTERVKELEQQNVLLHDQLETMSGQMLTLQNKESQASNVSSKEENVKSPEQLLEVIRFLRKDKEIAVTKCEVAQAESGRLKTRLDFLEKQLTDLQKSTNEERSNSDVALCTATQHSELMRKIETLNVLSDSNKLLREEKERFQKQVLDLEEKLKKLESEISPLEEKSRNLEAQKDALIAEKISLKSEVTRWSSRTNHLIEQCNKMDPEEVKKMREEKDNVRKQLQTLGEENRKLKDEKENIRKQLSTLTEENHKHRAEISQINSTLSNTQKELTSSQANVNDKSKEIEKITADLEVKINENNEKIKTIQQVRKIGRKYKAQYDELKTQFDQMQAAGGGNTGDQSAIILAAQEQAKQEVRQEMEIKMKEGENNLHNLQDKIKKLFEQITILKQSEENLKVQANEKEDRAKKVLQSAKIKITQLNNIQSKQQLELDEFKQKCSALEQSSEENDLRLSSLKSQYEGKIARLEKIANDAQDSLEIQRQDYQHNIDKLQKEIQDLTNKVTQQQKQLESQQKQRVQQQTSKPSTSAGPVERAGPGGVEPPTANIKPMATPSSSSIRHPTPTPASKATASIRPMAIAPASATTQTPMAAVLPTTAATVTQTNTEILDVDHSSLPSTTHSPPSQIRQAPVQTVSPAIQSTTITASTVVPPTHVEEPEQSSDSLPLAPSNESSLPGVTLGIAPTMKRQREETEFSEVHVIDADRDSPIVKRTRMADVTQEEPAETVVRLQEQSSDQSPVDSNLGKVDLVPESNDTGQSTQVPDLGSPSENSQAEIGINETKQVEAVTESLREDKIDAAFNQILIEMAQEASQDTNQEEDEEEEEEEVIVVEDDDDNDDDDDTNQFHEEGSYEGESGEEDEEDQENDEEMEGEYGHESQYEDTEQMQDVDFPEDDEDGGEGMAEDDQFDNNEEMAENPTSGDDEVVEISDDEQIEESQMESQDERVAPAAEHHVPEPSAVPIQSGNVHRPPFLPRLPSRTERLPSVGRQVLTPFNWGGGQGPPFDEGDDGIVPSTPTLFVPRRNDGFAEAVSSPQVPQGRMFFSGNVEAMTPSSQTGLSQLASQGGMDDTRMDLSQFDDGGMRSVPSTPLHVSPPTDTAIVEPSLSDSVESQSAEVPTSVETGRAQEIPFITVTRDDSTSAETAGSQEAAEERVQPVPIIEEPEETEGGKTDDDDTSNQDRVEEVTESDEAQRKSQGTSQHQRKPIVWEEPGVGPSNQPPAPPQIQPLPISQLPRGKKFRGVRKNVAIRGGVIRGSPRGSIMRGPRMMRGYRGGPRHPPF